MKKRFLSLFLLALVFCIFSGAAYAEDLAQLEYEPNDTGITITGCESSVYGELVIPDEINGLPVTIIGSGAFTGCEYVTDIVLPESVEKVEDYAFYGCAGLKRVNMPSDPEAYGVGLFSGCSSLEYITLPEDMEHISDNMFYGCTSLRRIKLPAGIKSIGDNAFYGCESLRAIVLPTRLEEISRNAFQNCSELFFVRMPRSITYIGEYAFSGCSALSIISLPEDLSQISTGCFYGCESLRSISIPLSVIEIKNEAFAECFTLEDIRFEHDSGESLIIAEDAFMLSFMLDTVVRCPDADRLNPAISSYEWEYSGRKVIYSE